MRVILFQHNELIRVHIHIKINTKTHSSRQDLYGFFLSFRSPFLPPFCQLAVHTIPCNCLCLCHCVIIFYNENKVLMFVYFSRYIIKSQRAFLHSFGCGPLFKVATAQKPPEKIPHRKFVQINYKNVS